MLGVYRDGDPSVYDELNKTHLNPQDIDDKILIYERQVKGWFIKPAERLLDMLGEADSAFLILSVCLSCLEGIQQYIEGKSSTRKSKKFFTRSFQRVYATAGLDDRAVRDVYDEARCGLFHDGMTRSRIVYNLNQNVSFRKTDNGSQEMYEFSPRLCLEGMKADFNSFIKELQDPSNITRRDGFGGLHDITQSSSEPND
jgi:hypothetical protein